MAEQYIMKQDTIILCVVPATTPRLTSYSPIALIKKHGKIKDTILALTMRDRVQDENVYELIVERMCNLSDELDDLPFAGCTAVINRNSESMSLMNNNKRENEWFIEHIIECMPDNFEHHNKLMCNIGTKKLVENIDIIYNTYIKSIWIPKTIEELQADILKTNNMIQDIGPKSMALHEDLFNNIFQSKNIFDALINESIKEFDKDILINILDCDENITCDTVTIKIQNCCKFFIDMFISKITKTSDNNFNNPELLNQINGSNRNNLYKQLYDLCKVITPLFISNDKRRLVLITTVVEKWYMNLKIDMSLLIENNVSSDNRKILIEKCESVTETVTKLKDIN